MLMLSRVRDHLSHLGLCNLISKYPTHSFTLGMHLQHNASCFRAVHRKETLQDIDHELHRSVVVIDQHNLIDGRCLGFAVPFSLAPTPPPPPPLASTPNSSCFLC